MRLSLYLLLLAAPSTAQNYKAELLDAARLGDYHRVNYAASVVAVDTRDSEGRTALLLASMGGHAGIVALLLEKGANPNATDAEGKSALRHALHAHPEVAKALLEGGADANQRDGDGRRLLMNGVIGGDAASVRLLLDGGADPNIRNNEGLSPLLIAEEVGASEVVELLRAAGARKSFEEQLDVAIRGGDVEKVTSLLERDVDVDQLDTSDYQTPLMTALEHDNLEIVELLLAYDADPTVEGTGLRTTGRNALILAAARGNVEALTRFAEARLARKEWNDAMLANCASVEVARISLDAGADANAKGNRDRTMLMCAAEAGASDVVSLLLSAGADPNEVSEDGWTAIERAELHGHADVITALEGAGATR